ncbi:MAG: Tex family protein [Myxococcota bacterium]|nr:Tex family protein [Myxococcota bacterium]
MPFDPVLLIARELALPDAKVSAVVQLLADGNTVPFVARYRKEATGNLDEIQIRTIEERHQYLAEFHKRRQAILTTIEEQGKLTDELKSKIEAATTKAELEDLYLPYKPKRRTRATIAREKGLEPLAVRMLEQPETGDPLAEAEAFVDAEKGVEDVTAALKGARDIAAEIIAENAEIRTLVRNRNANQGALVSQLVPGKADASEKFKDYYDYSESIGAIPSHRFLAVRRGEREGVLKVGIQVENDLLLSEIATVMNHRETSPFSEELTLAIHDSYQRLLSPSVETDLRADLKMAADRAAVEVFASNLRSLLLAPPFGTKPSIGIDPGLRTGCKCAAVSATGKFLGNMTFNLVQGKDSAARGKEDLAAFVKRFDPGAIAVGNGTGGREAEKFAREALREASLGHIVVVQVSEAGASVYSASELAGKEFPDLDLTVRGAISIARRLQDPLAELVKIEPKSIGVGQYQHDVHQPLLVRKLDEVVESCVNHVGVTLNTASAPLLARVAGIGPKLAENIVAHREVNGAFKRRKDLLGVAKLGPKAFEQAAGFLRIPNGEHPLDASAVHPERYGLVEQMASDIQVDLALLTSNASLADRIDISSYVSDDVGEPTLRDIIAELKKPGLDPRDTFNPPAFREDVQTMEDLQEGMKLEGIVTNVTAFGAFVDVGVHQDGLVHVSELADRFVRDPAEIVKVGDKISVRVIGVDLARKRISLSAKSEVPPKGASHPTKQAKRPQKPMRPQKQRPAKFTYNPFADLLKK